MDTSESRPPPLDTVAGYVRLQRALYGWKQQTLATTAHVSLSTVQRVERGEPVRAVSLEKLASALKLDSGAFTRPRVPLSPEEAMEQLVESFAPFAECVPVSVAPLRTERQVRTLAATHMAIVTSDIGPDADDEVSALREWLDLTSFMRACDGESFGPKPERSFRIRRLYRDVMEHVEQLEKNHKAVCLAGTYSTSSNHPLLPKVKVGVLAVRSRDQNPAAGNIRTLLAPKVADAIGAFRDFCEQAD